MRRFLAVLVVAVLGLSSAAAAAAAPPDLSGYWGPMRGTPPEDPVLKQMIAPGAVILDDVGAAELPQGDYGGLKPTSQALAAAARWKPQDEMALNRVCTPPSIVYAMQGPFPFEIHQGTQLIVIRLEYYDMVRLVFMDGRGHPPAVPHSKLGHSVGRWEGEVLVVDTTHLSAATITNNGLDHSDKVHLIERFRLSADGKTLYASQEFEDPVALQNRGARLLAWQLQPGQHIFPYECDPSFGVNYRPAGTPRNLGP